MTHRPRPRRCWHDGCRNASELWREIKKQGYPGSRQLLAQWVYQRREQPGRTTPLKYLDREKRLHTPSEAMAKVSLPASRRLVWLFLKPSHQLESEDLKLRDRLLTHPTVAQAKKLAQNFQRMVRERKSRTLDAWLKSCDTSKIPELVNFAAGLRRDYASVEAALHYVWSNGQTEGQVHRLKLLKRQMYGRANFDLLRLRCLHPT